MGAKLVAFYQKAKEIAGAKGKIELIKLVGLAESQAEAMPDSPELIAKFEQALKQIRK